MLDGSEVRRYFEGLGRRIDQRWSATGRSAETLAPLAARILAEHPVPDGLGATDVLGGLALGRDLPRQRPLNDAFGQPPAVFYLRDGLEVQALTWMEGTTSIHQHGFDGAFRVLCGSSLHVRYRFEPDDTVAGGHLTLGRLRMQESEVLRAGATRPIVSGPDFIHALFHLERPSVTIVVRNTWSDRPFPQYDYRPPGLGVDVLYRDEGFGMQMRALHSLQRIEPDAAGRAALDLVVGDDLWTAYRVTEHWFNNFGSDRHFEALAAALAQRHGDLASMIDPAFAEQARRSRILARRGMLAEPRHRLFLALLVNLPDRASVLDVMAQLFPGEDPHELTVRLVAELSSADLRGVSGLRMGTDDLAHLEATLRDGDTADALTAVSERWQPPSLLESLFV